MYEKKHQPLLPRAAYYRRLARHGGVALIIVLISLGIGILGYRYLENLSWIDALLNASMILGGMGPVNTLQTDEGKLFASFYALFSGAIFLIVMGVLAVPVIHRILHRFHLE